MNLKIRDFRICDIGSFVRMLGREWNLGKRVAGAGKLCDWIYAFEILRLASEIFVLVDDSGRRIGFGGYNQKGNPRRRFWRTIYRAVYDMSFLCVKNRAELRRYYDTYDYAPDDVKKLFDAEVTILIVDKELRGQKSGRLLFDEIVRRAAKSGVKSLRIDTDDSCGVGFYIHAGCREIYKSKTGKDGERLCAENVYVFGRNL